MNVRIVLFAALVAVIGAGALMMCDESDAATGDVLKTGSAGTSLTYTVTSLNASNSQVELAFTGSGDMTSWTSTTGIPWNTYSTKIVNIILPDGLTSIGNHAFDGCNALTSIEIPDSVTTIGEASFYYSKITTIEIPDSVTTIGNGAFFHNTALTSVKLPAGIIELTGVFSGCTALTTIEIPDNVVSLQGTFNNCTALTSVKLPAGLNMIRSATFSNCTALTTIELPPELTIIFTEENKLGAFQNSGLTAVTIPEKLETIGKNAFKGCTSLTAINAGADVFGIFTAPGNRATLETLTVDGTAAQVVRIAVSGNAELIGGSIAADDIDIEWDITPDEYGGTATASPDVLVYPAKIHIGSDNGMGVWMTAISILLVVGLIMTLILPMIARRME